MSLRRAALAVPLLLALVPSASAQVTPQGCQHVITAIPATLKTAGQWCLNHDWVLPSTYATVHAISIAAPGVTLDLGGFKIDATASSFAASQGFGIYSGSDDSVIRNGRLVGFWAGTYTGGDKTVIEGLTIEGAQVGIFITTSLSTGNVVRRCTVHDAGSYGMLINGQALVTGNFVYRTNGGGRVAIYVAGADSIVAGNTMIGTGNPADIGVLGDFGGGTTVCRDNTARAMGVPYSACNLVGTTNYP